MLDIGWSEMLIIGLVTIIVVGPKELPRVLRTVTQMLRKLRAMASEFQSGIDDLAREAELQDLKQSIEKTASTDIAGEFEKAVDPTGEVSKSVQEIEGSLKEDPRIQKAPSTAKPDGEEKKPQTAAVIAPPHSLGDSFEQAGPATSTKQAKARNSAKAPPKKRPKRPAKPGTKAGKARTGSAAGK